MWYQLKQWMIVRRSSRNTSTQQLLSVLWPKRLVVNFSLSPSFCPYLRSNVCPLPLRVSMPILCTWKYLQTYSVQYVVKLFYFYLRTVLTRQPSLWCTYIVNAVHGKTNVHAQLYKLRIILSTATAINDHRQMFLSTRRLHSSHLTKQHQKNLQLHLSVTISILVWQPLPQHIKSHPSTVLLLRLHSLP